MKFLNEAVRQLFQTETDANTIKPIGGGCIHQAGVFQHNHQNYFIKWNSNASEMFEAETKGLVLLKNTNSIDVPEVIGQGAVGNIDYLCLEYIESRQTSPDFWESFGQGLAELHKHTANSFGLGHDNFIGSLRQINKKHLDWTDFFINERLIPQLKMARDKGFIDDQVNAKFDLLFKKLPHLIPNERPSLLHGDLWSGNFLVGDQGQPVIFDPAAYYGHREAEIAFTGLFGGFDDRFYENYETAYPLQPGYKERVGIFNLYPLLVHVNLFGLAYLSQVKQILAKL
ncbi:Fructosamine-3-kinase [Reichenbachiella faecimaris]|uniref:Fructosamine-3-kinase n=1 Tax=Reichenbachiella faecimaris TaxID=692418 RepID=A0A1W2GIQ2_REIFA|nr:fructosamine kinase family protein [Reichenbachiella faecimaris]SMD36414.1 Fructosamine-3-kinase [Reichenbachiella faecimaris]